MIPEEERDHDWEECHARTGNYHCETCGRHCGYIGCPTCDPDYKENLKKETENEYRDDEKF